MTENTPEALYKIVEKLVVDLKQIQDCSEWECEECPLWLKHIEEEPAVWKTHMWLGLYYYLYSPIFPVTYNVARI